MSDLKIALCDRPMGSDRTGPVTCDETATHRGPKGELVCMDHYVRLGGLERRHYRPVWENPPGTPNPVYVNGLLFEGALELLRKGRSVRRRCWPGYYSIRVVGEELIASNGQVWRPNSQSILGLDWEPCADPPGPGHLDGREGS